MRIISQQNSCGSIYDLPYEAVSIVRNRNKIMVRPLCYGLVPIEYAQYSTQEKAEKAMQKLQDGYEISKRFELFGYKAVENMISWSGKKETMNFLSENIFSFRFPQEDEL